MSTRQLWQVFEDLHNGNIDVDYGGGVIKQRIARSAEGKSGGYRAVIYYRKEDKTFFMHGFSKKDKENIDEKEEKELKKQARIMLGFTGDQIEILIKLGKFKRVIDDEENL